jgi:BspA type Leucine rich repeat region (6 copies)
MKTKILILLLAIAPLAARAQFTFTTNSGAITITGYNPAAGLNVVIPASTNGYPVTAIGTDAFDGLATITNVTIPDSVTSIGDYAFENCHVLTSVTIPNSVTSIGQEAFVYCFGLTSVTIPNSVISIGDYAFFQCSVLKSVTIPDSITNIGVGVFEYCSVLTSVTIPNSVTSIGDYAFFQCPVLKSVTIPNSVTNIGVGVFLDCSGLHQAYFQGNAPLVGGVAGSTDNTVFEGESGTAYYYAGTSGWGTAYGGWPTVELFAPPQLGGGDSIGIQSGNFGFTITGATNQTVIVEASTNLVNWQPIWTNTLSGVSANFTDPQWTNYPDRFYRAR